MSTTDTAPGNGSITEAALSLPLAELLTLHPITLAMAILYLRTGVLVPSTPSKGV